MTTTKKPRAAIAQHTPGPWKLTLTRYIPSEPPFGYCIEAAGKIPFVASAGCAGPNHTTVVDRKMFPTVTTGFDADELEANARLIAAAPELLEALREKLAAEDAHEAAFDPEVSSASYGPEHVAADERLTRATEACRAAIAKAEGRT